MSDDNNNKKAKKRSHKLEATEEDLRQVAKAMGHELDADEISRAKRHNHPSYAKAVALIRHLMVTFNALSHLDRIFVWDAASGALGSLYMGCDRNLYIPTVEWCNKSKQSQWMRDQYKQLLAQDRSTTDSSDDSKPVEGEADDLLPDAVILYHLLQAKRIPLRREPLGDVKVADCYYCDTKHKSAHPLSDQKAKQALGLCLVTKASHKKQPTMEGEVAALNQLRADLMAILDQDAIPPNEDDGNVEVISSEEEEEEAKPEKKKKKKHTSKKEKKEKKEKKDKKDKKNKKKRKRDSSSSSSSSSSVEKEKASMPITKKTKTVAPPPSPPKPVVLATSTLPAVAAMTTTTTPELLLPTPVPPKHDKKALPLVLREEHSVGQRREKTAQNLETIARYNKLREWFDTSVRIYTLNQ